MNKFVEGLGDALKADDDYEFEQKARDIHSYKDFLQILNRFAGCEYPIREIQDD